MNLPNKLTVLRVIMIPLFLAAFFAGTVLPHNYLVALALFALASFTDLLDGKIARKRGLVTDFGKLMDPLADKLLVMAAMICLITVQYAHPLAVIVILAREFLVTSIRLVAASGGTVIAADIWGKMKTVFQMIWLSYALLVLWVVQNLGLYNSAAGSAAGAGWLVVMDILSWIVLALTVLSGFNYTWKNRSLFGDA